MTLRLSQDPRNLTASEIWAEIEADPEAVARIRQGGEDIAAGRWYTFDTKTGESTPNPDWPKDGPQPRRQAMSEPRDPEPEEPDVRNDPIPEPVRETDDDSAVAETTPTVEDKP